MRKKTHAPTRTPTPHYAKAHRKSAALSFRQSLRLMWQRVFCHRNIIIISRHKTEHVPLSSRLQLSVLAVVLLVVVGASYSVGNFVAVQQALREKERKIASASLENQRVESEFALLKRDMIQMLDESGDKKQLGEYAQFIIGQYKNGQISENDIDMDKLGKSAGANNAVFQRIAYLEHKVADMKESHELVLDSIRSAARGKLSGLEDIIKTTGLNSQSLEKKAQQAQTTRPAARTAENTSSSPQGGPFVPADEDLLDSYDPALYRDLSRLALLSDVTEQLPLAKPMNNYRLTSGFGVRIDPFRHTLARHTGLDFSGPIGSQVHVTSDGRIEKAGRYGAYGNAIIVSHAYGVSTLYGHLSKILVKPGQVVHKGEIIGVQGSTGRSTGNHLHYEVMYNGVKLNPANFLKAGTHVRTNKNNPS